MCGLEWRNTRNLVSKYSGAFNIQKSLHVHALKELSHLIIKTILPAWCLILLLPSSIIPLWSSWTTAQFCSSFRKRLKTIGKTWSHAMVRKYYCPTFPRKCKLSLVHLHTVYYKPLQQGILFLLIFLFVFVAPNRHSAEQQILKSHWNISHVRNVLDLYFYLCPSHILKSKL